ncbi:MAG: sxtJ [Candidatus Omnitrophica bacterium]|nr:sxtJ [Candidatus Omnitrophota bacterium]
MNNNRLSLGKSDLRKFGFLMGFALCVITGVIFLKHQRVAWPNYLISLIFFILAAFFPAVLKPVYIIWMKFAHTLGWINTRLILFLVFYLILTPIGIITKLFRIDFLERKISVNRSSYWKKREEKEVEPLDYERQF